MIRILLVEDNEANRDMLSRRLKRRGFEVHPATNGKEAIAQNEALRPDVILMDISMPVMDGLEAIRHIRVGSWPDVRIIALTANACPTDREEALAVGADDYDTKPVDFSGLLKKIKAYSD